MVITRTVYFPCALDYTDSKRGLRKRGPRLLLLHGVEEAQEGGLSGLVAAVYSRVFEYLREYDTRLFAYNLRGVLRRERVLLTESVGPVGVLGGTLVGA